MDGLVDSLHYDSSNKLVSFNAMTKLLNPGQVTALNERLGDTWLTCLKFFDTSLLVTLYYIKTNYDAFGDGVCFLIAHWNCIFSL